MKGWYDTLRYRVVPPTFVVVFTMVVQVLARTGQGQPLLLICTGNMFSWWIVTLWLTWAFLWLTLPGPTTNGPPDPDGHRPTYRDNGLLYYCLSLALLATMEYLYPGFCSQLYEATPEILGSLSIVALVLCGFLYLDAPPSDLPGLYVFYSGGKLHPRLFNVDIKQLTNCRVGLMGWQLLVVAYFYHGMSSYGFNLASFTNFFLQTVYLLGFFYWESFYFHTLDMTMDRAGYYLCWGCLVWVPCFYTYSSYVLATWEPVVGWKAASGMLACGTACLAVKTLVDMERWVFKKTGRLPGGRGASYILASYIDAGGNARSTKLLLSGTWGAARHLNYTFEILTSACWCLPGFGLGHLPFLYLYFLTVLLVHRVFRDEEKCLSRYGEKYREYCKKVPYRFLPYIL